MQGILCDNPLYVTNAALELMQLLSWCSSWADAALELMQLLSWWSAWADEVLELMQLLSWSSSWAEASLELKQLLCWSISWADAALELKQLLSWSSSCAEAALELIQLLSSCWTCQYLVWFGPQLLWFTMRTKAKDDICLFPVPHIYSLCNNNILGHDNKWFGLVPPPAPLVHNEDQ